MKKRRAIEIDDFKKIDVISDPQMAPDGSGYAFAVTSIHEENDYQSNLYFQHLNKTKKITQWTFGKHKNSAPRFSPDGKLLAFQSNRTGTPQIWLMNLSGGEAKQLTAFKNGATTPTWTPDGKNIIFTASLEENEEVTDQQEQTKEEKEQEQNDKRKKAIVIDRLKYKAEGEGITSNRKDQIVLYNLASATCKRITAKHEHHTFQDVSPDGKSILFTGNLDGEADYELASHLYVFHLDTDTYRPITKRKGSYAAATYSPDGKKIVLTGHDQTYRGATQTDMYLIDVPTGKETCLSSGWDFEVGDVMIGDMRLGNSEIGPVWSKDSARIFFIGTANGATQLYEVDVHSNLSVLYQEDHHVFGFAYDENTASFVLGISSPTLPGDFYRLDQDGRKASLTNMNATFLNEVHVIQPESVQFTAEDGITVHGWLLRPYGFDPAEKYPLILEIHGGPHMMYGQTFFHEMQLLAARGYVVLYLNPRGSYGYGQAFVDGCRKDYGGKDYRDLMQGLDIALERYNFIDENRLGVTGGSYGGFMTNWIVGHTDRFKAAVTQRSISNWLSFYGVSDIGYFFNEWEHGLNLLDDPQALWDISPLKYAGNVETPLLIMHGEEDQRCPIEQGEQLYVTLKHMKKEVEFVRFPGAGHELSRSGDPLMRKERLHHLCRWFDAYL